MSFSIDPFEVKVYVKDLKPDELKDKEAIFRLSYEVAIPNSGVVQHFNVYGKTSNGGSVDLYDKSVTPSLNHTDFLVTDTANNTTKLSAVFFKNELETYTSIQFKIHYRDPSQGDKMMSTASEFQTSTISTDENVYKFPVTKVYGVDGVPDKDGVIIETLTDLEEGTDHLVQVTCWVGDQSTTSDGKLKDETYTNIEQQTFTTQLISSTPSGEITFNLGKSDDFTKNGITNNTTWDRSPVKNIINQSYMGKLATELLVTEPGARVYVQAFNVIGSDNVRVEGDVIEKKITQPLDTPEYVTVEKEQIVQVDSKTLKIKLSGTALEVDTVNALRSGLDIGDPDSIPHDPPAYILGYVVEVKQGLYSGKINLDGRLHEQEITLENIPGSTEFTVQDDVEFELEFHPARKIGTEYKESYDSLDNIIKGKLSNSLINTDIEITQVENTADPSGRTDTISITYGDNKHAHRLKVTGSATELVNGSVGSVKSVSTEKTIGTDPVVFNPTSTVSGSKATTIGGELEWCKVQPDGSDRYIVSIDRREFPEGSPLPTSIIELQLLDLWNGPVTYKSQDQYWIEYYIYTRTPLNFATSNFSNKIRNTGNGYSLKAEFSFVSIIASSLTDKPTLQTFEINYVEPFQTVTDTTAAHAGYFNVEPDDTTTDGFASLEVTFRHVYAPVNLRLELDSDLSNANTLTIERNDESATAEFKAYSKVDGHKTTLTLNQSNDDGWDESENKIIYDNTLDVVFHYTGLEIGHAYRVTGSTVELASGTHPNSTQRMTASSTEDDWRLLVAASYLVPQDIDYSAVNSVSGVPDVPFTLHTGNDEFVEERVTREIEAKDESGALDSTFSKITFNITDMYADKTYRFNDTRTYSERAWKTSIYEITTTKIAAKNFEFNIEPSPSYSYAHIGESAVHNLEQVTKTIEAHQSFEDIKNVKIESEYKKRSDGTNEPITQSVGNISFYVFTHNTDDNVTEQTETGVDNVYKIKAGHSTADPSDPSSTVFSFGDVEATDHLIQSGRTMYSNSAEDTKIMQAAIKMVVTGLNEKETLLNGQEVDTGNNGTYRWSPASKGLLTTYANGTTITSMDADGYALTEKITYTVRDILSSHYGANVQLKYKNTSGAIVVGSSRSVSSTAEVSNSESVSTANAYGKTETQVQITYNTTNATSYFTPVSFHRNSEAIVVGMPITTERTKKDVFINYINDELSAARTDNSDTFQVITKITTVDKKNDYVTYQMENTTDHNKYLKDGLETGELAYQKLAIYGTSLITGNTEANFLYRVDDQDTNTVTVQRMVQNGTLRVRLGYKDETVDGRVSDSEGRLRLSQLTDVVNAYEGNDKFIIIDGNEPVELRHKGNGDVYFNQKLISGGSTDVTFYDTTRSKQRYRMSVVGSATNLRDLETNVHIGDKQASMTWRDHAQTVLQYFRQAQVTFEAMRGANNSITGYTDITGLQMTVTYENYKGDTAKNPGKKIYTLIQDPDPKIKSVDVVSTDTAQVTIYIEPGYNSPLNTLDTGSGKESYTTAVILDMNAHYAPLRTNNHKVSIKHVNTSFVTSEEEEDQSNRRRFEVNDVTVRDDEIKLFILLLNGQGAGYELGTLTLPSVSGTPRTTYYNVSTSERFNKFLDYSEYDSTVTLTDSSSVQQTQTQESTLTLLT